MVKGLHFHISSQMSKLKSQISSLEARNNVIRSQNEGLCDQVASLRAAVDSLVQGLKAAQSNTQVHGRTSNGARGSFQHHVGAVRRVRGDKEHWNGVPDNCQIAYPNLIVVRGKSLMEIPSPAPQPPTARSPNTDTVKRPQHTSLLSPASQFMPNKRKLSTMYLKALRPLKTTKLLKPLALLQSFGSQVYPYRLVPSRISRLSEPSTEPSIPVQQRTSESLIPLNIPAVRLNQQYNHEDKQVICHMDNKMRQGIF